MSLNIERMNPASESVHTIYSLESVSNDGDEEKASIHPLAETGRI